MTHQQPVVESFGLFGYGKVNDPQIRIITHIKPDIDAFVAMYLYWKFYCQGKRVLFCLIPAGGNFLTPIPGVTDVYIDIGDNLTAQTEFPVFVFNHHDTNNRYVCSATLVADHLGITDNPGVIPLIGMACSRDHVEEREDTDLSMILPGIYGVYKFEASKDYDMPRILREAFMYLSALYTYWSKHAEKESENPTDLRYVQSGLKLAIKDSQVVAEKVQVLYNILDRQRMKRQTKMKQYLQRKEKLVRTLRNRLTVARLRRQSDLKGAALEDGVDVVIWSSKDPDEPGDHYGITMSRKVHEKFTLQTVYEALCREERKVRGDEKEPNIRWFLHVSGNLVLCGSLTQPLKGDDKSRLVWEQFEKVSLEELEKIELTTV